MLQDMGHPRVSIHCCVSGPDVFRWMAFREEGFLKWLVSSQQPTYLLYLCTVEGHWRQVLIRPYTQQANNVSKKSLIRTIS